MEKQLFAWENYDEMACGEYVFSPVELIQDVGPFVRELNSIQRS